MIIIETRNWISPVCFPSDLVLFLNGSGVDEMDITPVHAISRSCIPYRPKQTIRIGVLTSSRLDNQPIHPIPIPAACIGLYIPSAHFPYHSTGMRNSQTKPPPPLNARIRACSFHAKISSSNYNSSYTLVLVPVPSFLFVSLLTKKPGVLPVS